MVAKGHWKKAFQPRQEGSSLPRRGYTSRPFSSPAALSVLKLPHLWFFQYQKQKICTIQNLQSPVTILQAGQNAAHIHLSLGTSHFTTLLFKHEKQGQPETTGHRFGQGSGKTCRKEKRCLSKDFSDGEEESRPGADFVIEAVGRPSMLRMQHTQRVTRITQELLREQADVCRSAILKSVKVTHEVCWLTRAAPALRGRGRRIVSLTTTNST